MITEVSIAEELNGPTIKYTFPAYPMVANEPVPMPEMQFELQEYHWHVPTLMSLLSPKMFCKLLTAVLLERSLVFVHDNLSILSSVVLAFKTLIRPFQWSYLFVPVLPAALIDSLELP